MGKNISELAHSNKIAYIKEYNKANYKTITLKFHSKIDRDILDELDKQKNVAGFIKALIRANIHDK